LEDGMPAPDKMFLYPKDVDAFAFDWGRLALTCAPEVNGAKQFSAGVVDLPSGQGHSRHNHPGSEEIIFVISGNGEQMVEDDDGNPVVKQVGPAAPSSCRKAGSTDAEHRR
jgi:oxalate decarboxylase/phosphoglucose isomerase-like protein (cupin superfamily)